MGRPSKYSPEFRRDAVELVRSSDRTVLEIARSLGILDTTLYNWVRADREARDLHGDELCESEREELRRLRKENAELKLDREILRKAAAYFARETMR